MKIILITDLISQQRWAYRSIAAALAHIENPLDITQRRWSQIIKTTGYPFTHSGCLVEKLDALGMKEVIGDNPPIVEPKNSEE
jgi:hypothetical protein